MKVIMKATMEFEIDEEKMGEAPGFSMEMFKDGTVKVGEVKLSILDEDGNEVVPQEELRDAKQEVEKLLGIEA